MITRYIRFRYAVSIALLRYARLYATLLRGYMLRYADFRY